MKNKDIKYSDLILENKETVYPCVTYIAGLIIGSFLFTYSNPITSIFKKIYTLSANDFSTLLLYKVSIYLIIFAFTVLLGMCLIGYPFISIIPLVLGIEIAMKTSYYYINHPIKGIGYSLLMIAPESAAFVTILVLSISMSSKLSKYIYSLTMKKDTTEEIELRSYLKNFLIYAFFITLIAFVNALATYLLSSIIRL